VRTFFTADTHFFHRRILEMRPRFAAVEDMNEALVAAWNAKVGHNDVVYHLGDFALAKVDDALRVLKRLNGRKHLVAGNHDKSNLRKQAFASAWAWVKDLAQVKVEGHNRKVFLCHYAMRVWNRSHHGAWHLHGHSHGSLEPLPHSLSMDVGVDCAPDFAPFSYDEVKANMLTKEWRPVDHHGRA
jgi:calcineurin-like phosphoesterase family protein